MAFISLSTTLFSSVQLKKEAERLNFDEAYYSNEITAFANYFSNGANGATFFVQNSYLVGTNVQSDAYAPTSYTLGRPLNVTTTSPLDPAQSFFRRYTGFNISFKTVASTSGNQSCGVENFGTKRNFQNCLYAAKPSGGGSPGGGGGGTTSGGGTVSSTPPATGHCPPPCLLVQNPAYTGWLATRIGLPPVQYTCACVDNSLGQNSGSGGGGLPPIE